MISSFNPVECSSELDFLFAVLQAVVIKGENIIIQTFTVNVKLLVNSGYISQIGQTPD